MADSHAESTIRKCESHDVYYCTVDNTEHQECESYSLQWREVTYYLNKLNKIRKLYGEFRTELSF